MKVVYQTDVNGVYLGEVQAQESPLEPDVYLVPAGAVLQKPPTTTDNEVAVWSEQGWEIKILTTTPESETPVVLSPTELRLSTIKQDLLDIDTKKIRAISDLLLTGDSTRLIELENQAQALRLERSQLLGV